MKASRSRLFIVFGSLTWLLLVVGFYYAGHKPFSPGLILRFATGAWHIFASLFIISLGGGLSRRLFRSSELDTIPQLVLQSAIGLGLLSITILAIGSFIGINQFFYWLILILLGIVLWRETFAWLSAWRALPQVWITSGRLGKALGLGITSILFINLIIALAPPVRFDALVYHLTLPKIYLNTGAVGYVSEIMFWGMPQVGEMLYTLSMALSGGETAAMLGWWVGILALCGLLGYSAARFGKNAGWVAAITLVSGYTTVSLLSSGYVEWFSILFGVGVLIALDHWWIQGDRAGLFWAGVLSGLAMGTKYTSAVLLVAGVGVVLVQFRYKKLDYRSLLLNLIVFVLPALFVFSPWLVKNFVATGNPVYPLFFPAGSMDNLRLETYQLPPWGDWKDILALPIRASITGFEGAPGYSASISPLLLALAPFSLLGYKSRKENQRIAITIALLVGIIGTILWVLGNRFSGFLIQTRLYFGIFPAYAVLAGIGYGSLAEIRWPGLRLGRIVGVMIGVVMAFNLLQVATEFLSGGALNVLFNVVTPEDYLNNNLGWYFPASQAIKVLPEGSRVLMLWEPKGYYCQPGCIPDEVLDQWRRARSTAGEPAEILARWRDMGYTHVLFNRFGANFIRREDERYQNADWVALDALLASLGNPVDFGSAYELYSLLP